MPSFPCPRAWVGHLKPPPYDLPEAFPWLGLFQVPPSGLFLVANPGLLWALPRMAYPRAESPLSAFQPEQPAGSEFALVQHQQYRIQIRQGPYFHYPTQSIKAISGFPLRATTKVLPGASGAVRCAPKELPGRNPAHLADPVCFVNCSCLYCFKRPHCTGWPGAVPFWPSINIPGRN